MGLAQLQLLKLSCLQPMKSRLRGSPAETKRVAFTSAGPPADYRASKNPSLGTRKAQEQESSLNQNKNPSTIEGLIS